MPRLSGLELALDLSKIDPGIKIILLSALDRVCAQSILGNPQTINILRGVKLDHFSMPADSSELLEMINRKIKYGEFDEYDIIRRSIRRYRLRKLSPDWYFRRLWYRVCHHKRIN